MVKEQPYGFMFSPIDAGLKIYPFENKFFSQLIFKNTFNINKTQIEFYLIFNIAFDDFHSKKLYGAVVLYIQCEHQFI